MSGVVTLTLNPSLDITAHADRIEVDTKIRCTTTTRDPGGGGLNVARAMARFGDEPRAVWTRGGLFGDEIARLLDAEGLDDVPIDIEGDTRISFAALEEGSDRHFRFSGPGPELTDNEIDAVRDAVTGTDPDYLVLSGGLTPGAPDDLYAELAEHAARSGARVVLDSHGAELRLAIESGHVFLVKPNYRELAQIAGADTNDDIDVEEEAKRIVSEHSVDVVVVSLGKAGALLVTEDTSEEITAPTVPIRSRIGAGDTMVGALVHQLAGGADLDRAVRYGVAAGAAAVTTEGTELAHTDEVDRLFAEM